MVFFGSEWVVKAWGWFPMRFLFFGNVQMSTTGSTLNPLFAVEVVLRNARRSQRVFNMYNFRKYENLVAWTCRNTCVPNVVQRWVRTTFWSCERYDFHFDILNFRNSEIVLTRRNAILGRRAFETLKLWNFETLKVRNFEILKFWNFGDLECWKLGISNTYNI